MSRRKNVPGRVYVAVGGCTAAHAGPFSYSQAGSTCGGAAGLDIALHSLLGYCALIAVQDFSVTFSNSLLISLLMRVIKALARWRWRA